MVPSLRRRQMPDLPLRDGWRRVTFGDVVRQVRDRVDPDESGLDRYVAGEHMDTDDLRIRRWGTVGNGYLGPAFHMRFKPGHVLYGSRRTYLRKVAVADFEGITANTTFILEPKDPQVVLPDLLPFVMQSEAFHDHSKKQSKGSVNPYVNFSDLAWYEFALPPPKEQRRIAKALRAAEDHRQAQDRLSTAAATLLQATVDEAFAGQVIHSPNPAPRVATDIGDLPGNWVLKPLAAVCSKIVDGVHKRPDYVASGIPFLTIENLNRGPGIDFSDTRYVSREDHAEFCKRTNPESGDVLVSKDGTLGIARVVETEQEFSIFVSVALLKPKRDQLDPWFLRYYFDSTLFRHRLAGKTAGSALKHIHLVDFRESIIPVPPYPEQQAIAATIRDVDAAYRRCLSEEAAAKHLRQACLAELMPAVAE
jgi:type I restriction enzyme S subunit